MKETVNPPTPIVLIEDAEHVLNAYRHQLTKENFGNYLCFKTAEEALGYLAGNPASLILLDLKLPGISGEDALDIIGRTCPSVPVIVVTASEETHLVVRCMKAGAFDYLVKPVGTTRLITAIRRALELHALRLENQKINERFFRADLDNPEAFGDIITRSPDMEKIFRYIEAVAPSAQPVFITGETGTGKEMIAHAVHRASGRKGNFVAVTVAGLEENVFSDTLFGHARGAFTGADRNRPGLIEQAADGTLFLDEIGDLGVSCQVKLLRLIQEGEYYPLGSDTPHRSSARIVLATNKDLAFLRDSPHFRRDLYFRIATHHVHISPLRERRRDIPLLFGIFLSEARKEIGKSPLEPPAPFLSRLERYDFPGNVRELKGLAYDAASMCENGDALIAHFDSRLRYTGGTNSPVRTAERDLTEMFRDLPQLPTLSDCEEALISEAVLRSNGNRTAAAAILGTTRQLLHRRLRKTDAATTGE